MKICPYCEKENPNSSSLCWFCSGDISNAPIRQDSQHDTEPNTVHQGYQPTTAHTVVRPSRGFSYYLKRLFDFRGRAGRGEFILIYFGQFAAFFVVGLMLSFLETMMGLPDYSLLDPFTTISYLLAIIISLAVIVRRLHDIGYSGWAILLLLIPVVNFIMFLILIFKGGTSKA